MDFPASGTTENLTTAEQWCALFSRYSHVILVANSDQVNVKELQAEYPRTALFVFFNKVYKILDEQFSGHSLLISRAQPEAQISSTAKRSLTSSSCSRRRTSWAS